MSGHQLGWWHRVAVLAVVAASGVAVIYVPQPIQPLVAEEFGLGPAGAGASTIAVQAGYALGILVLVSAGDRFDPRRQVVAQLVATSVVLAAAAASPTHTVYVIACLVAGATATHGQIVVTTALRLAPQPARARTVAVLLGVVVVGLFATRTGLGALAGSWGWRGVLVGASAVLALLVIPALVVVPRRVAVGTPHVGKVLASLPRVARTRHLQLMTAVHALAFSAFIAVWATSTVHAVADLGLTVAGAAALGVTGIAAGVFAIAVSGTHSRLGARRSVSVALYVLSVGAVVLTLGGAWLPGLLTGLFLMTLGMITSQVTTQAGALAAVVPGEVGRANTVYLVTTFVVSSVVTAVAGPLWQRAGFVAVSVMAATLSVAALILARLNEERFVD